MTQSGTTPRGKMHNATVLAYLGFDFEDQISTADIEFAMGGDPGGYEAARADMIAFED
jgi:hypothetical protein